MNWYVLTKKSSSNILIDISEYENSLRERINSLISYKYQKQNELNSFVFNQQFLFNILQKYNYRDLNGLNNAIQSKDTNNITQYILDIYKFRGELEKSKAITFEQGMEIWEATKQLRDLTDQIEMQDPTYSISPQEYLSDIETLKQQTYQNMEKIANEIRSAINRIENWNGSTLTVKAPSIDKDNSYSDPEDSAMIEFSDYGDFAPSFSYFVMDNKVIIDDVLEAGDTDFFTNNTVQSDYFNLIKELNKPGSSSKGRYLTLYTARPIKDRKMYLDSKEVPSNIFLTNNYNSAEGIAIDLSGAETRRDVWKIVIDSRYLVQTLDGMEKQYQVVGNGMVPVKSMELLYAGE